MASQKTLQACWDRLKQSFRQYMAAQYPGGEDGEPKALFLGDLAKLPDAELIEAVGIESKRPGLFPNDNLAGILLATTERLVEDHRKAQAKAEGERKHQAALEGLAREKLLLAAAGSTLGAKPESMSFRDWLRDKRAAIESEPDPLLRAGEIVGSMEHEMDPRLREAIIGCITKAAERRAEPAEANKPWSLASSFAAKSAGGNS